MKKRFFRLMALLMAALMLLTACTPAVILEESTTVAVTGFCASAIFCSIVLTKSSTERALQTYFSRSLPDEISASLIANSPVFLKD